LYRAWQLGQTMIIRLLQIRRSRPETALRPLPRPADGRA
jgi:hypothetical protein